MRGKYNNLAYSVLVVHTAILQSDCFSQTVVIYVVTTASVSEGDRRNKRQYCCCDSMYVHTLSSEVHYQHIQIGAETFLRRSKVDVK